MILDGVPGPVEVGLKVARVVRRISRRVAAASLAAGTLSIAGCNSPTYVSCGEPKLPADQSARITNTQGVGGTVWEWIGDFQPGSQREACGTVSPAVRTILIYPVLPAGAFPGLATSAYLVDSIPGTPVDSARSDSTGFFQAALPTGAYSLVTREGAKYYVRVPTNDFAYIGRIDVTAGQVTKTIVHISYQASF